MGLCGITYFTTSDPFSYSAAPWGVLGHRSPLKKISLGQIERFHPVLSYINIKPKLHKFNKPGTHHHVFLEKRSLFHNEN